MAKVSISSLVVVGAKEIIRSGKLYDESVDLPAVINGAPQAQIFGQITSKQAGFHAFWPPKQRHNHPYTPSRGLIRPIRPVDHPSDRPIDPPGPYLGPPWD